MSLDSHLTALERRHSDLDHRILEAMTSRPAVSDGELGDMKRRKLKIRDEIERLRASMSQ